VKKTPLMQDLDSFNSISRELISDISVLTDQLESEGRVNPTVREKVLSMITELEWRAIQLDTIFEDTKSLYLRYPAASGVPEGIN